MGSRYSVVIANVSGRDLVGFVEEEAKALIAQKVALPTGYRITWGGQFENQQRAAARLTVVVPVALALIFVLLFSTFGSVRQALLILSNIPFALVGGIVALWLTGEYLSVPASVGFIALLGIAVLNGVVLVSHFNQLHGAGTATGRGGGAGRQTPSAAGADDGADHRLRTDPAAVRDRARFGDPAATGDRGDRRPDHGHRADADAAADPLSALRAAETGGVRCLNSV
jgi:Cu/Ag efflux pump CusA